jgi:metallo-beta-lactamase class B
MIEMRLLSLLPVTFGLAFAIYAQDRPTQCSNCAVWNMPQQPFRIHGNTYYVGTHGLGAVLVTSDAGHILIDGALPESAPLIVASIRSLGFRIEDVKLIVNSHAHFDHAGAIAEIQKLSGARVAVSPWTANVMKTGAVPRDDPQFGTIAPIAKVANVETIRDGQTLTVGAAEVTAHFTPGHTPGGTTWTWLSCENGRCLNLIYVDSVTAVSADGFLFSRNQEYPHAVEDFERSIAFIDKAPCDILITPHPEVSNLFDRLAARASRPDALIDPKACHAVAEAARDRLRKRIATETGKPEPGKQ